MKPKKNPQSDFSRKSLLFFQIGLILVLFISWQAVEWKTYEKHVPKKQELHLSYLEEEDVPVTEMVQEEIPVVPKAPDIPEVVDQIVETEEPDEPQIDFIEANKPEVAEPPKVGDIVETKTPEKIQVPFDKIEEVPIFPGCEKFRTNSERKKCMSEKIFAFINKRFDRDLGQQLGLKGTNSIYVTFKINENGEVVDVVSRGTHRLLEKEAESVVKQLPHMKPGRQGDENVSVLFALPISFQVK